MAKFEGLPQEKLQRVREVLAGLDTFDSEVGILSLFTNREELYPYRGMVPIGVWTTKKVGINVMISTILSLSRSNGKNLFVPFFEELVHLYDGREDLQELLDEFRNLDQ